MNKSRIELLSKPPSVAMTDVDSFVHFVVVTLRKGSGDPLKGCSQETVSNCLSYLKSFLFVYVAKTTLTEVVTTLRGSNGSQNIEIKEGADQQSGLESCLLTRTQDSLLVPIRCEPRRLSSRSVNRIIVSSRRFIEIILPKVGGSARIQDSLKFIYAKLMCDTIGDSQYPKAPPDLILPFTGTFLRFLRRCVNKGQVSVIASLLNSKKGWPQLPEIRRIESILDHRKLICETEHDERIGVLPAFNSGEQKLELVELKSQVFHRLKEVVQMIGKQNSLAKGEKLPLSSRLIPSSSACFEAGQAVGGAAVFFDPLDVEGFSKVPARVPEKLLLKTMLDESKDFDERGRQRVLRAFRREGGMPTALLTKEKQISIPVSLRPVPRQEREQSAYSRLVGDYLEYQSTRAEWFLPSTRETGTGNQVLNNYACALETFSERKDDCEAFDGVMEEKEFQVAVQWSVRAEFARQIAERHYLWSADLIRRLNNAAKQNGWFRGEIHPHDHPVQVMAIPEPSKFRLITKGPAVLYTAIQPIQGQLISFWKKSSWSTMTADVAKRVEEIYHGTPQDWVWYSVDYKSATDLLSSQATREALLALNSVHPLGDRNEIQLALSSVSPALVHYDAMSVTIHPDDDMELIRSLRLRAPSQIIRSDGRGGWTEVVGLGVDRTAQEIKTLLNGQACVLEFAAGSFPQTNGQLMGHPLSFPLLCMANLAVYIRFVDEYLGLLRGQGPSRDSLYRHCLINGDDMLFRAPRDVHGVDLRQLFGAISESIGLVPSLGKNYRSDRFAMINNRYFVPHNGGMKEVGYLNPKLLLGLSLKTGESEATPVDISKEMNRMFTLAPWTRGTLHGCLKRFVTKFYRPGQVPNWFIPAHLGGCGIDPELFVGLVESQVTKEQRKVAAYMMRNHGENLFRSGMPGIPGWVVEKMTTHMTYETGPDPQPAGEEITQAEDLFERFTVYYQLSQLGLGKPNPKPTMWWPSRKDIGGLRPCKLDAIDRHWFLHLVPKGRFQVGDLPRVRVACDVNISLYDALGEEIPYTQDPHSDSPQSRKSALRRAKKWVGKILEGDPTSYFPDWPLVKTYHEERERNSKADKGSSIRSRPTQNGADKPKRTVPARV